MSTFTIKAKDQLRNHVKEMMPGKWGASDEKFLECLIDLMNAVVADAFYQTGKKLGE